MPRTMLQLRIEALSHHLDQVSEPDGWKQRLDLPVFNVENNVWTWVIGEINNEASAQLTKLETLDAELRAGAISERDGWRRYERVQRASEEIFQECLDLLGGLALRDRIQDERICRVADEYITELASATGRNQSFSIPGLDARFSSTMRRVAKMQFPEWTVWTLPLVAHEYGRVVIDETRLKEFTIDLALEFTQAEVATNEVLRAMEPNQVELTFTKLVSGREIDEMFVATAGGEAGPTAVLCALFEHQRRRVRVLVADAVATLLAGPAYACAALMLRLDPLGGERRDPAPPDVGHADVSDRDRATTILSLLTLMCTKMQGPSTQLADIVDGLAHYWRESVAASHGISIDDVPLVSEALPPIAAERVHKMVVERLVSYKSRASYEAGHARQAQQWGRTWVSDILQGVPAAPPVLPAEGALIRESLNAAWHARVEATKGLEPSEDDEAAGRVRAIGVVALDLCEMIIEQRYQDPRRGDPGGGTPLGAAARPRRTR